MIAIETMFETLTKRRMTGCFLTARRRRVQSPRVAPRVREREVRERRPEWHVVSIHTVTERRDFGAAQDPRGSLHRDVEHVIGQSAAVREAREVARQNAQA